MFAAFHVTAPAVARPIVENPFVSLSKICGIWSALDRDGLPACSDKPFCHMNDSGATSGCAGNSGASCGEPMQKALLNPASKGCKNGSSKVWNASDHAAESHLERVQS